MRDERFHMPAAVPAVTLATLALLLVDAQKPVSAQTPAPALACPTSPSPVTVKDYSNKNWGATSFAGQDLTNANFQGATFGGASFVRANLTGANFSGATFADPNNPALDTDFAFANLNSACFIGAKFDNLTYFEHANLACADFSQTEINKGTAVFGQSLVLGPTDGCRTAFRQTTMNCEFLAQWGALDLSSAQLAGCFTQMAGKDFSGARMVGVDLSGAVLDGARFVKADLSQALLSNVSAKKADFSDATLFGAQLNGANLEGASLYHAFLANNTGGNISNSASLQRAHLKNANLAFAELSGVNLTNANFYGDTPAASGPCATTGTNNQGFTKSCATARGANLTDTTLANAYLYGVDWSSAIIAGADFSQAVLVASDFSAASMSGFSQSGKTTTFSRALLQGANLRDAVFGSKQLASYDLSDAFVDFVASGGILYINLNGANHNRFAACPATGTNPPACGQDVCVLVKYSKPTTVPVSTTGFTCPNGSNQACGAAAPAGNVCPSIGGAPWKSSLDGSNPPPGVPPVWYDNHLSPKYTCLPANAADVCAGKGAAASVLLW